VFPPLKIDLLSLKFPRGGKQMFNEELFRTMCEAQEVESEIKIHDYKEHFVAFGAGIAFGWLTKLAFDSGIMDPYLKKYGLLRNIESDESDESDKDKTSD